MDEDFKDPFDYNDLIPLHFKTKSELPKVFEEIYKNTENTKIDWRKRELALKKIGRICLGNQGKSETFLQFFNGQIYPNLDIQLADLRSSLMKEACRIVSLCAKELGMLIETPLVHMMTQYVLFKIAGNTNKVISENSSKCVLNIVKYVHSVKIIINVCEQKILKANNVRVLVAQCIYYIICLYKHNLILKTIGMLLDTIKSLLSDPNSEVRLTTRRVFLAYKKRYPEEASKFFEELEKSVQKQILEDEKIYWDFTFIKVDNSIDNNESTPIKKQKNIINKEKIIKTEENKNINEQKNENTNINININNTSPNIELNNELNNGEDENNKNKKEFTFTNLNLLRKAKIEKNIRKNKSQQKRNINKNILKSPNKKQDNTSKKEYEYEHTHENNSDSKIKESQSEEIKINNNNNLITTENLNIIKNSKKKTQTEEKILILIKKLDETNNMNDKLLVFQYLFNDFTQILNDIKNFSEVSIRKFIDIHIEYLGVEEIFLVEQVIKNLMRMIFYMNQIFNNYDLESIIKLLLYELTKNSEKDKPLLKLIFQLFEVMRRKCNNEELIKILFSLIKEKDNENPNVNQNENEIQNEREINNYNNNYNYETCYDWIIILIPTSNNLFKNINNFKKYFKKICSVVNQNSSKIIQMIEILYKYYNDNFIKAYIDENENNQNKILNLFEKNNTLYYEDLLHKIKIKTQKENSIINDNNYKRILNNNASVEMDNYEEVPEEILTYLEKGDIDSFKSYLENHKSLVPSFLLLLSNSNYNKPKYVKNLINFTYTLISTVDIFIPDLEQVIELFINQIIHLLLTNKKNNIIVQTTKEILSITPFKLNSEKYFKTISQYLNMRNDPILLESLLLSIKNFVLNNKTQDLEKYMPYFIEEIISLINHQAKEVKEQAVYCCVEIFLVIGHKFDTYFDMLTKSQQNLINFFIKKRISN